MKIPESKTDPKYKVLTENILAGLKMMVEMGTSPSKVAEVIIDAINQDENSPSLHSRYRCIHVYGSQKDENRY